MRGGLVLLMALSWAAAAGAQDYRAISLARDAELNAGIQAARSRDIVITNELSALQSRMQTNQALSDIAALRAAPPLPTVAPPPGGPAPVIDISQLATIPDATLAASNARVRAAADNRR
jgi:hypothetical protein